MKHDTPTRFRIPRGEKPRFHSDPAVDDLMAMVTALTCELAVLRERLDTHERLAELRQSASPAEVDHFEPCAEAQAHRAALRAQLVDTVFRPLLAAESDEQSSSHAAIVEEIEGAAGGL